MKKNKILIILGIAVLFALPQIASASIVNAGIQMLVAALFASAFNVLCGQAGMLSFGHAAYFGVGTFATTHAMNAFGGAGLLPTPLMPLAGALAGLVFGSAVGWFATKRSGAYFAMITLALAELLHAIAPQLKTLFGGEAGISSMRMPAWGVDFGSSIQVYYLTLVWVLVSIGLLYLFTRTPVGRLAQGIRENSHRLRFLGYNVHLLSVLVFAVSAMFAGIAGGLQAMSNEAANYVLLDAHLSASVVLNSFIGGVSAFLGPALGASVMTFFGYMVSDMTESWLLYQGLFFVLVMMFMPNGLAGMFRWLVQSIERFNVFRLLPVVVFALAAGTLLTAGTVFIVEICREIFSQDYRSLTEANPSITWPVIQLFDQEWVPNSLLTWIVPVVLFGVGCLFMRWAKKRWQVLIDGPVKNNLTAGIKERKVS